MKEIQGSGGAINWITWISNFINNNPGQTKYEGIFEFPTPGDVLHKGTHVQFVEEVWESETDRKVLVIVSEENYYPQYHVEEEKIHGLADERIAKFRKVVPHDYEVSVDEEKGEEIKKLKDTTTRFIRPNYPKQ